MGNGLKRADIILLGGLTGIFSALLTFASDMLLLGRPVSSYLFLQLGTQSMADLAHWRITSGTFLGIIVLPFQIIGLTSVYHGLKPAGKLWSYIVLLPSALALIMGIAFHVSYVFIGDGWKLVYLMGPNNSISSDIINRFVFYWKLIIIIIFIEILVSSVCFAVIILTRKTLYPKWMSIFNPICVFIFLFPMILIIPAPVGGYIAPGYLNLADMVFFTISTIVIYRTEKSYLK